MFGLSLRSNILICRRRKLLELGPSHFTESEDSVFCVLGGLSCRKRVKFAVFLQFAKIQGGGRQLRCSFWAPSSGGGALHISEDSQICAVWGSYGPRNSAICSQLEVLHTEILDLISSVSVGLDTSQQFAEMVDVLSKRVFDYRHSGQTVVLKNEVELINACKIDERGVYWKKICDQNANTLKPDYTVWNLMKAEADSNKQFGCDFGQTYIPIYSVSESFSFHRYLLGRAAEETMIYGSLPLYAWFSFFCSINGIKKREGEREYKVDLSPQLNQIVGILKKLEFDPFWIRKGDYSQLEYVNGFYHLVSVFEALLGLCNFKMGLSKRYLSIGGDQEIDLYAILDEMTLNGAHDPKRFVMKMRAYSTFCARMTGVLSNKSGFLEHVGFDIGSSFQTNEFKINVIDGDFLKMFVNSQTYQEVIKEGRKQLKELNLLKTLELCELLLNTNIIKNAPIDVIMAASFCLSAPSWSGFGRSAKYLKAPELKGEDQIIKNEMDIGKAVEQAFDVICEQAERNGFFPVTPDNWVRECTVVENARLARYN